MRAHVAKERLAVRVAIFKIVRDRPGIGDDLVAVDQDRNPPLAGKGNDILLGKAPRDRLDLEFLMGERHLDAPAIWAEPSFIVGRCQIVERRAMFVASPYARATVIGTVCAVWPNNSFFPSSVTAGRLENGSPLA